MDSDRLWLNTAECFRASEATAIASSKLAIVQLRCHRTQETTTKTIPSTEFAMLNTTLTFCCKLASNLLFDNVKTYQSTFKSNKVWNQVFLVLSLLYKHCNVNIMQRTVTFRRGYWPILDSVLLATFLICNIDRGQGNTAFAIFELQLRILIVETREYSTVSDISDEQIELLKLKYINLQQAAIMI